MSQGVINVTSENFDNLISKGVTLVDFWAPWCGPCRMQGPIVERVAATLGDKAVISKINVDEEQAPAQKFNVTSIPTLIIFKDGKPAKQFVGVQSEEVLLSTIEGLL
ncbi:MAG: thioredoxin [Spirochaetales bacterium]|nr:thioredoxin [Spirochaetales bacterium]